MNEIHLYAILPSHQEWYVGFDMVMSKFNIREKKNEHWCSTDANMLTLSYSGVSLLTRRVYYLPFGGGGAL